ncbi:hypothetical protein [Alteromonas sp. BMJM2]|uniref:hypothetical protein n=1 Tax=Alteromonas sp. BMJM2 TaxID=2954241 RepID=UPI0022B5927C|nr:hypothetical protein [Alteromonas sp. BMJM2]
MLEINADCLTVGELKEKLDFFEDHMLVVSNVSFGDRLQTQQAIYVDEVDIAALTPSSYSESGCKVIDTMNADPEDIKVVSLNWGAIE